MKILRPVNQIFSEGVINLNFGVELKKLDRVLLFYTSLNEAHEYPWVSPPFAFLSKINFTITLKKN